MERGTRQECEPEWYGIICLTGWNGNAAEYVTDLFVERNGTANYAEQGIAPVSMIINKDEEGPANHQEKKNDF